MVLKNKDINICFKIKNPKKNLTELVKRITNMLMDEEIMG